MLFSDGFDQTPVHFPSCISPLCSQSWMPWQLRTTGKTTGQTWRRPLIACWFRTPQTTSLFPMHRYTGESFEPTHTWPARVSFPTVCDSCRDPQSCRGLRFYPSLFSQLHLQVCVSAALWAALQRLDVKNNSSSATGFHTSTSKSIQTSRLSYALQ